MASTDAPLEDYTYDGSQHAGPPFRIQWRNRDGYLTDPRWVFLLCCGQIGSASASGSVIASPQRCDLLVPEGARGHTGSLILHSRNATRAQARRLGGDLAEWSCCGARALPAWSGAWDAAGRIVCSVLACNGCSGGSFHTSSGPAASASGCSTRESEAARQSLIEQQVLGVEVNPESFALQATPMPARNQHMTAASAWRESLHSSLLSLVTPTGSPHTHAQESPAHDAYSSMPMGAFSHSNTHHGSAPATFTATAIGTIPSQASAAPTPGHAIEGVLRDVFGLTLDSAARALWPRGAGGDGTCERLAASGDRLLEWIVVRRLPSTGSLGAHSEGDIATHTVKYTRNSALCTVARFYKLDAELRSRTAMHDRAPSEHELGTVIEALLMSCYESNGMPAAEHAVSELMAVVDAFAARAAAPVGSSGTTTSTGSSAAAAAAAVSSVTVLMDHVVRLGLPVPLFEVETVATGEAFSSPSYRVRILLVDAECGGQYHDEVELVRGGWRTTRAGAREDAAAALLLRPDHDPSAVSSAPA